MGENEGESVLGAWIFTQKPADNFQYAESALSAKVQDVCFGVLERSQSPQSAGGYCLVRFNNLSPSRVPLPPKFGFMYLHAPKGRRCFKNPIG